MLWLIVIIVMSGLYLLRNGFNYWKQIGAPYVPPKFPRGNLSGVGKTTHFAELLQTFYNQMKSHKPFFGLYFFFRPVAVITDLDLAKRILIKDFQYFHDRGVYNNEKDDPLSAHMISLEGEKWRQLRAKLTPTFTSGKMKFMFPTIVEVGERLQQRMGEIIADDPVLEIKTILANFTTDVIGTCAFGIECNSLYDKDGTFREMGKLILQKPRHSQAVLFFLNGFSDLGRLFRVKLLRDEPAAFFYNIVRDTIESRKTINAERNDFIHILMELMAKDETDINGLTLNQIAAQAFLFFIAGFETSSTLLHYCFYEMSANQAVQDKARSHIEEILNKHDGKLTYEAMLDMKYLDCVLNEGLRKYPPIGAIFRRCKHNYTVPGTTFVIPKGGSAIIPVYGIHYDPDIYADPQKFDPERFTDENTKNRNQFAFLPFGEGPRMCIGMRFGMMQARIALIMLLRKYRFTINEKTAVPLTVDPTSFIITPKGGIFINVTKLE